jgi:hypothetical protein
MSQGTANGNGEQRKFALTDHDIERIGATFDRKIQSLFEVIGYDTSTPESRTDIRKDHEFVRGARNARGKVAGAAWASLGTGIAWLLYVAAKSLGKAP